MRRLAHSKHGIALVIVLAFLVLITVLVIGFFSSVASQVGLADAQSSAVTTQQLADSAVNLVMAQMADGTRGQDASQGTTVNLAWASQPGMLRTYDATGTPKKCYKLYSSDKMVIDASDLTASTDLPPDDWKSIANANLYVDINAPAVVTLPPKSTSDSAASAGSASSASTSELIYPIVDPQADGKAAVKKVSATAPDNHAGDLMGPVLGFSVVKSPGYDGSADDMPQNNRAPMPVRWLYVLRDGTMASPTGGSGTSVTVTGATAANPIVGRVAFWADDECSKVNINTASEGVYWDMPRVWSNEDFGTLSGPATIAPGGVGMAVAQPAQHEFQRYSGHPATTCLSPIFGTLAGLKPNYGYDKPYPARPTAQDASSLDGYYNIAARVGLPSQLGGGGSKGGTTIYSGNPIVVDQDRLYASVDELIFTPLLNSTNARVPNDSTNPSSGLPTQLQKSHLEKAQFFLTAHSNAPEVTLFNTPRISIWPVNVSLAKRTAFDSLSAFCSTIGKSSTGTGPSTQFPFYFTRSNPRSTTEDFNQRNQQLYAYLQKLTSTSIPGFGGDFLTKLGDPGAGKVTNAAGGNDRDQLLTEIFDYIRCTSLQDPGISSTGAPVSYTPLFNASHPSAAGEVLPISINGTQGFGRFHGLHEAVLMFYATENQATAQKTSKMRALFLLQPSSASQGTSPMQPRLKFNVYGLEKFKCQFTDVTGSAPVSLNFVGKSPSVGSLAFNGTNFSDGNDITGLHGRGIGGTEMVSQFLFSGSTTKLVKPFNNADAGNTTHFTYPFFSSADIPVPAATGSVSTRTFQFVGNTDTQGDEIRVEILSDDNSPTQLQVYHFKFPSAVFTLPAYLNTTTGAGKWGGASRDMGNNSYYTVLPNDSCYAVEVGGRAVVSPSTDVSTLTDSTAGDDRMVQALPDVPANRFRPHQNYLNGKTTAFAHSLMLSIGEHIQGGTYGNLTAVSSYYQPSGTYRQPAVPSRAGTAGVKRADGGAGDWDTGWGDQKDGAHINKPDEGDTAFTDQQNGGYRVPYSLGYQQGYAAGNNTFFSPTRMVPSPMMFGSLPTGIQRMQPWQTLSFAPRPEDPGHPGNAKTPKDHLIADLFWMPVVEPWAISTPFATGGKINLNYQIRPFTYLKRQTGLYAVMRATKFLALTPGESTNYKPLDPSSHPNYGRVPDSRYAIDVNLTLQAFEAKFTTNQLFKSATEICEMDLFPVGYTGSMSDFWKAHQLTGDNAREKPYVDLYPRLTTKSNSFTVHVRVQTLRKARGAPVDQFDSSRDRVLGEYRGSSLLERYIDLNDPKIPDFATQFTGSPTNSPNIDRYYKMRIVSTKRFAP